MTNGKHDKRMIGMMPQLSSMAFNLTHGKPPKIQYSVIEQDNDLGRPGAHKEYILPKIGGEPNPSIPNSNTLHRDNGILLLDLESSTVQASDSNSMVQGEFYGELSAMYLKVFFLVFMGYILCFTIWRLKRYGGVSRILGRDRNSLEVGDLDEKAELAMEEGAFDYSNFDTGVLASTKNKQG